MRLTELELTLLTSGPPGAGLDTPALRCYYEPFRGRNKWACKEADIFVIFTEISPPFATL